MDKTPKYKVLYFKPSSPLELQNWLDFVCLEFYVRLVAVNDGYYIFEHLESEKIIVR